MQRNFMIIKNFLEQEFPELQGHITGGNYPPPPYAVILMQLISIIHLMVLPLVFIGDALWSYLPYFSSRGPPTIYKKAKEYPMQFFTVLFFVIPTLIQSKVTTGAFEIAVDGQVVFSKLQMGRFPEADDLIKIFSATK